MATEHGDANHDIHPDASAHLAEVRDVVDAVLREQVGAWGFRGAEVRSGLDHDGDEVLIIDAYYDRTEAPVNALSFYGLTRKVRESLRERGESRFPHIRNHFDESQQVAV